MKRSIYCDKNSAIYAKVLEEMSETVFNAIKEEISSFVTNIRLAFLILYFFFKLPLYVLDSNFKLVIGESKNAPTSDRNSNNSFNSKL